MKYIFILLFLILLFIITLLYFFYKIDDKIHYKKLYIDNLINYWKNNIGIIVKYKENEYHINFEYYKNDYFLMFDNKDDYNNHIHLIPFEFAYTMKYNNINSKKIYIEQNNSVEQSVNLIIINYKKFTKKCNMLEFNSKFK